MKTKTFLKRIREEDQAGTMFANLDMIQNIMEIEELLNNFKIMYGADVELNFKTPKPITGKRWYGKGIAEKLIEMQK